MKHWLLAASLICFGSQAHAESLDLGGITDFIASTAKQARGGTALLANGKPEGLLYLPLWTLKGSSGIKYAHFGAGGGLLEGGRAEPLIAPMVNAPACWAWLLRSDWAQKHIESAALPDIWIGPIVKLPLPGKAWIVGEAIGGAVSIGLGK
jgi:hypothetical protein